MRRTLVLALAAERPATPRPISKAIVVRRLADGRVIELGLDEDYRNMIPEATDDEARAS